MATNPDPMQTPFGDSNPSSEPPTKQAKKIGTTKRDTNNVPATQPRPKK